MIMEITLTIIVITRILLKKRNIYILSTLYNIGGD
jgi:hypothetical protein